MTILDLLKIARRWWWVLVLCPVLAGGAAYIVSSSMTPIYRANLTALVEQSETGDEAQFAYNDVLAAERQARTFSYLMTARPVLEETVTRLGLSENADELGANVSVAPIRDTQLIRLSVDDPSPERAATIANTIGQVFIEQLASTEQSTEARIIEEANPPSGYVQPKTVLNTAVATLLGLLAAAGLVLLLNYLDDTVKSSEDVRRLTGKPALAGIPMLQSDNGIETASYQRSPATESFRGLRTNLQFVAVGQELRSLVLTSARPGDGKTTTVANLGTVLAQGGQQVILMDADLRKPRLHKLFDSINNRAGLTNLLISTAIEPESLLQDTDIPGVRVLTSGPLPPNPPDLLNSAAMRNVIQKLEDLADYVLIDSPPMAISDPLIVAGLADGILLVTLANKTRSTVLARVIQDLERSGTPLLGVVLNQMDLGAEDYYYYYQSYYSSEPDDPGSGGDKPSPDRKGGLAAGRRISSIFSGSQARIDDRGP